MEHKDNPKLLLKALANQKNKALYADTDISLEDEEIEMSANIELFGNDDDTIYEEEIYDEADDISGKFLQKLCV